ncbi:hypothetical protein AGMMS49992_31570 [Clostridia bacterium]|nr:hypothetical protein AGMMS49992_31570 [Clostridia bacterium]
MVYTIKEFKSGKLVLSTADLSPQVISDLTGAKMDDNGVLVSSSEDGGKTTGVGFRAKRPEGNYRYFWLMKVKFASPSVSLQTKGDSIQFNIPKIEGTIMRRNKLDAFGTHPWKVEVTEGEPGVPASVIANWFSSVYEATVTDNEP